MEHLKKHTLDLLDWIDYRPNISILPLVAIASIAIALVIQLPAVLLMIVAAVSVTIAIASIFFAGVAFVSIVGFRALRDGVRLRQTAPTKTVLQPSLRQSVHLR